MACATCGRRSRGRSRTSVGLKKTTSEISKNKPKPIISMRNRRNMSRRTLNISRNTSFSGIINNVREGNDNE